MKKQNYSTMIIIGAVLLVIFIYYIGENSTNTAQPRNDDSITSTSGNPTIDINPDTSIRVTSIPVAQFYDGQDGYSLSISSGNRSTCIWTWEGGSASIPYSQTTTATSATEKHTIVFYPDNSNYKVTCVNDFGDQYIGVFPNNNY